MIITGDFNAPDINWLALSGAKPFSKSSCDIIYTKNLIQLVTTPTHRCGNSLDIVLTNSPNRINNISTDSSVSNKFSDHFLVHFAISCTDSSNSISNSTTHAFNFFRADYYAIDDVLFDFRFSMSAPVVNLAWTDLRLAIENACTRFIPSFKQSPENIPRWYTSEIRHNLKRLRTLRRLLRKKETPTRLNKLSQLTHQFQCMTARAKENYIKRLISDFNRNPQKIYSHLKQLSDVNSMHCSFYHNNSVITSPAQIAELFNAYFNSTFTSSDFILPSLDQLPIPSSQLSEISTNQSEVFELLSSLDPTKSLGNDGISPKVLKHCATSLTEPLTHLCNLSFQTSQFPHDWKIHRIRPIPKKGDLHLITNYRPISLLPILSKVVESIVYTKLIPFIRPKL